MCKQQKQDLKPSNVSCNYYSGGEGWSPHGVTRLFLSMIAAESKLCFYHKPRRFIVVLSALFVNKNNSYAHVNYSPQDQLLMQGQTRVHRKT